MGVRTNFTWATLRLSKNVKRLHVKYNSRNRFCPCFFECSIFGPIPFNLLFFVFRYLRWRKSRPRFVTAFFIAAEYRRTAHSSCEREASCSIEIKWTSFLFWGSRASILSSVLFIFTNQIFSYKIPPNVPLDSTHRKKLPKYCIKTLLRKKSFPTLL